MNVLLLGPQGSGKGTQAKRIAGEYGLAYVGTGDIMRAAVARDGDLGGHLRPYLDSGTLVPDELTVALIRDRLDDEDSTPGFVLDGFPRTMAQADALDALLRELDRTLDIVFELQVSKEVSLERLLKRAREEGRSDDTPDVIETRLATYHRETAPLAEHYRAQGILVGIHGERTINEVFAEIQQALEQVSVRR